MLLNRSKHFCWRGEQWLPVVSAPHYAPDDASVAGKLAALTALSQFDPPFPRLTLHIPPDWCHGDSYPLDATLPVALYPLLAASHASQLVQTEVEQVYFAYAVDVAQQYIRVYALNEKEYLSLTKWRDRGVKLHCEGVAGRYSRAQFGCYRPADRLRQRRQVCHLAGLGLTLCLNLLGGAGLLWLEPIATVPPSAPQYWQADQTADSKTSDLLAISAGLPKNIRLDELLIDAGNGQAELKLASTLESLNTWLQQVEQPDLSVSLNELKEKYYEVAMEIAKP